MQRPENQQEGATLSSGLELWKANQAVRLAELRLTAQATALAGAQTRATTIIGWVVASLAVTATLAFKTRFHLAGYALLTGELVAGMLAVLAILPLKWGEIGAKPLVILEMQNQTELTCQQSIALYYQNAIIRNANRLQIISRLVTGAWILFLATPAVAFLVQMIKNTLTP